MFLYEVLIIIEELHKVTLNVTLPVFGPNVVILQKTNTEILNENAFCKFECSFITMTTFQVSSINIQLDKKVWFLCILRIVSIFVYFLNRTSMFHSCSCRA